MLKGEPPQPVTSSSELSNLLYFVGDDLREAALAVGGIEAFLVQVEELLAKPRFTASDVEQLNRYVEVAQRVEHLGDSLDSLCRSLFRLREGLAKGPVQVDQTPAASKIA